MLALGLNAWDMIDSQHFKEPKVGDPVGDTFPALPRLLDGR